MWNAIAIGVGAGNPGIYAPAPYVGLLDLFPNAAAAYSLHKLRSDYTGNAIQVRRSSDNNVLDIGFTALGDLDTTALTAFCGAGNGFVTTWYEQSGNSRNAIQPIAENQPQIVNAGSLITLNSKSSMLYTGNTGMGLTFNSFAGAVSYSISSVFSAVEAVQFTKLLSIGPDDPTNGVWYTVNTGNTALSWVDNDTGFAGNGYNNPTGPIIISNGRIIPNSITTQNLLMSVLSPSNAKMFRNGSEISYRVQRSGACYITPGNLILGNSPNNLNTFNGMMQEIVIWQTDQNSNIAGINNSLNSYYSAY